jgi:hypothetical protein
MWRDKSMILLPKLLEDGEQVIRNGDAFFGRVGSDAVLVLTNRRLIILSMGLSRWSPPNADGLYLRKITSADVKHGNRIKPTVLNIHTQDGTQGVILNRQSREEADSWPRWIMEAKNGVTA